MVNIYTLPNRNDPTLYPENELATLLCSKDINAFQHLYDTYAPLLHGIITKRTGRNKISETLLENVFIWIWHNIHRFDHSKERLMKWMINVTCKFLSDQSLGECYEDNNIFPLKNSLKVNWLGASHNIPDDDKQIIELAYIKNQSRQEIANELNIPEEIVKKRLHNAIATLRKSSNPNR